MSHPSQIFQAIVAILDGDYQHKFERKDVKKELNINDLEWNNSYNPVFQGMRIDQPGGAPSVSSEFKDVFRRVSRGVYVLTSKGIDKAKDRKDVPTWRESVLQALNEIASTKASRVITRKEIIHQKLDQIITQTQSIGETPEQTLSRVLQDLRDIKVISFVEPGNYLLLDKAIDAGSEELTELQIDEALNTNKLLFENVPVSDQLRLARFRRGQSRLRERVLINYKKQCAVCDVVEKDLLVASHISRWSDDIEARGNLTNAICLCSFHDQLFEKGYFALTDNLKFLFPKTFQSSLIKKVLDSLKEFREPLYYPPARIYLRAHRRRIGAE